MSSSIQVIQTLEKKQLLNDTEYREAQEKWGRDAFVAKMGGEAIRDLLENRRSHSSCRRSQRETAQDKVDASADEAGKTAQNCRKLCLFAEQA